MLMEGPGIYQSIMKKNTSFGILLLVYSLLSVSNTEIPSVIILPPVGVSSNGDTIRLECITTELLPAARLTYQQYSPVPQRPPVTLPFRHHQNGSTCRTQWIGKGEAKLTSFDRSGKLVTADGYKTEADGQVLIIDSFNGESHGGEYSCVVSCLRGAYWDALRSLPVFLHEAYLANFTRASSQGLSTSDFTLEVCRGNTVFLPCEPPESYPQALVFFMHENHIINSSQGQYVLEDIGLVVRRAGRPNSGSYRCGAINGLSGHTVMSPDVTNVIVNDCSGPVPAHSNVKSKFVTVPVGGELILPCAMYGRPPPDIEWTKFGIRLDTERFSSKNGLLFGTNITTGDKGTYICQNTYSMDGLSLLFHVSVQEKLLLSTELVDQTVVLGSRVVLRCSTESAVSAEHGVVGEYRWFHNGRPLRSSESSTFTMTENSVTISHVSLSDRGFYQCVVTNSVGAVTSAAFLSVMSPTGTLASTEASRVEGGTVGLSRPLVLRSGTASVRVRWNVVGSEREITSFKLLMQTNEANRWTRVGTGGVTNEGAGWYSQSVENLNKKNSYRFRVKAMVKDQPAVSSKKSEIVHIGDSPEEGQEFAKPSVSQKSTTSFLLSWRKPRTPGTSVKFYRVQRRLVGSAVGPSQPDQWTTLENVIEHNSTAFLLTHLVPGRSYKVRLSALLKNGLSIQSKSERITVDPVVTTAPSRSPNILLVRRQTDHSLHVRWSSGQGPNAAAVFLYVIEYRSWDESDWLEKQVSDNGAEEYDTMITNLYHNTVYQVRMTAVNDYGSGPVSDAVSANTRDYNSVGPSAKSLSPNPQPWQGFSTAAPSYPTNPIGGGGRDDEGYSSGRRRRPGGKQDGDLTLYVALGCVLAGILGAFLVAAVVCAWRQKRAKKSNNASVTNTRCDSSLVPYPNGHLPARNKVSSQSSTHCMQVDDGQSCSPSPCHSLTSSSCDIDTEGDNSEPLTAPSLLSEPHTTQSSDTPDCSDCESNSASLMHHHRDADEGCQLPAEYESVM